MPAEFLRDVVITRNGGRSSPRRWSLLPLSVAAHVAVAIAVFIMPLAAEIELPAPAPLSGRLAIIQAKAIPPAPAPHRPSTAAAPSASAAPREIPSTIAEEREQPHSGGDPAAPAVPGGMPGGTPGGLPPDLGITAPVGVPPPPPPVAAPPRPVRPGSGIRHPEKIVHVDPVYPAIARSAGVQGIVILEAVISTTGAVENVKVLRSAPLLDQAAIDAVRGWRYTPTRLNGVPVPVLITITINFTLHR